MKPTTCSFYWLFLYW